MMRTRDERLSQEAAKPWEEARPLSLRESLVLRKAQYAGPKQGDVSKTMPEGPFAPYGAMPEKAVDQCQVPISAEHMPKAVIRDTRKCKFRSMSGKLGQHGNAIAARVHTIRHLRADGTIDAQVVHDCAENDSAPVDPAWKAGQRSTVKKASPFRKGLYSRAKSATFSVEYK